MSLRLASSSSSDWFLCSEEELQSSCSSTIVNGTLVQMAGGSWGLGLSLSWGTNVSRFAGHRRGVAVCRFPHPVPGPRRNGDSGGRPTVPTPPSDGAENPPVEHQHGDAGNVERPHRGIDDEVGVVEGAGRGQAGPSLRVVHAERDRGGYGKRDDPCQGKHAVHSLGVLVAGVRDRICDGDVPGYTNVNESVI